MEFLTVFVTFCSGPVDRKYCSGTVFSLFCSATVFSVPQWFFPFRNGFCRSAIFSSLLFRNRDFVPEWFSQKNCFPELFRNRKLFKKKLPFRNVPNFLNGSFCSGTNKTVPEHTNCSGTENRVDVVERRVRHAEGHACGCS